MGHHDGNHDKGRRGKSRRILRAISILLVFCAAACGAMYRDAIRSQIGRAFAYSGADDPIPVLSLERGPLKLEVQANGEIVGLDSASVSTPGTGAGALKLAWLVSEGAMVAKGSPVIRFDSTDQLLNLESQNNTLSQNLLQTKLANDSQQLEEGSLDLDRSAAEMDYEYAMFVMPKDETLFTKWEIITAQLNAEFAKSKIENLAAKAKTQKLINRSQQQVLTIARNQIQTEVGIVRQTLAALAVKAPSDGLVVYRRERREDPKIGDSCQAGQVLIDLVDLNSLQARIYVLEREAGGLAVGEAVDVELDALPDKVFHGKLRSVSPVAATLERDSTLKYFTCDVAIGDAEPYLRSIKPGMTLQARVILEEYDSCFMVPASVLDIKNDKTYVYIKQGEGFEKREVQLGLGKHGQATILSGVNEKELIALKNPFEQRQLKLPDFSKATVTNEPRRGGPGGPPPGGGRGR